jgi:hypothetical protein
MGNPQWWKHGDIRSRGQSINIILENSVSFAVIARKDELNMF